MKTLKKTLGVVLALAMVIGCVAMAFSSFATEPTPILTVTADKTSVVAGDTVTLSVKVNVDGFGSIGGVTFLTDNTGYTIESIAWNAEARALYDNDADIDTLTPGEITVNTSALNDSDNAFPAVGTELFTVTIIVKDDVSGPISFTVPYDADTYTNWGDHNGDQYDLTTPLEHCGSNTLTLDLLIPTTDITLTSDATVALDKGLTSNIAATMTPANANDGATLVYSSDNTAVATVSDAGVITAVNEGTATITVALSTNASVKKTIAVTVKNPGNDNTLAVADTLTEASDATKDVAADAQYEVIKEGKFTTFNLGSLFTNSNAASDFTITFTVVKVDGTAFGAEEKAPITVDEDGVVAYVGAGKALVKVTASYYNGTATPTTVTKNVYVDVKESLVTDADMEVVIGDTTTLTEGEEGLTAVAKVKDTSTTTEDTTNDALGFNKGTYSSSDEAVIKVDATTGKVTPVGEGTAKVIYTFEGTDGETYKVESAEITVSKKAAEGNNGTTDNGTTDNGSTTTDNSATSKTTKPAKTGDAGVALAATLSLAAAAAFVFTKKRG
ncbi:MAG: Ig-like domain-containing protein [Clostridiales bacterium]|nr:Ig-like domain-containing protein [Clostridiales bacterium]